MRYTIRFMGGVAAIVVALTGCSSDTSNNNGGGGSGTDDVGSTTGSDAAGSDTISCTNTCDNPGATQCDEAGQKVTCADFDQDGCNEWGGPTPCTGGLQCVDGQCTLSCTDECEVAGTRQCNESGQVQTCADHDFDGCLEWGGDQSCSSGTVCKDGFCSVDCDGANECTVSGAKKCDGNGVASCADLDFDGCLEWTDPVACPNGQFCSSGSCAADCSDECSVSGAKRCDGTGAYESCGEFDGDGCLEWGNSMDCSEGEVCSNGFCAKDCTSECSVIGATKCSGDSVQTCGDSNDDGCLEWGTAVACESGLKCSNGYCTVDCTDECSVSGSKTCEGSGYKECGDTDQDGCLEWGTVVNCESGQSCSNGQCSTQCTDECNVVGAKKCLGDAVQQCGNTDGDVCLEWGTPTPCGTGEVCSNGFCSANCTDECTVVGASTCEGDAVKTCEAVDGCLKWSEPVACASGQSCSSGKCSNTCTDECNVVGAKKCSGDAVQTCGNSDSDVCLEWGTAEPCGSGQSCSGGFCTANCTDECTVKGAKTCEGNGYKTCDDTDEDGCLEWGTVTACDDSQSCSNGSCSSSCSDECVTAGSKQCSGNGVQTCGNTDADSCLEWGTAVACADGLTCVAGNCALGCTDECTVIGARQCSGPSSYQVCDDYDDDDCLEWGTAAACDGEEVCSAGNCALNCTNECNAVGAKQCNGAGTAYQACDDHDQDGCLEWGNDVACGESQACSAGQCASQCTDECDTAGMTQCNGANSGVQTCGDYNDDGCLQWGTAAPCGEAQTCTAGECVALSVPGTVVINEVFYDDVGSDENAFVELYGDANLDLSGFVLVGVNGSNGLDYATVPLSGSLSAEGYFVITTEAAAQALQDIAQQLNDDVDFQNGPDSVQLRWGSTVVDAVGYGGFGAGQFFAGEGGATIDVAAGQSLGRNASSADSDNNVADFYAYDEPTPGAANVSNNDKPTAALSCPSSVPSDQEVTVDASGSSDTDGSIVAYAFTWGDGFNSSGPSPIGKHTYASPDTYTVEVTVTDDAGSSATASCVIVLTDASAPQVTLTKPAADLQVTQGTEVTYITADVTPAPGRNVVSTRLVIDGTPVGEMDTIAPYVFDYTVPEEAVTNSTILVQVQATDDEGAVGISPARQLFVKNDPPVADMSAIISNNLEVTVNASGSNDTETDTADLEVRWDWENDGTWDTTWGTQKQAVHTYAADGEYTIAVQVRDAVGQTDTTTRTVNFQSVQDVSGTVTSTLWYGTINITGDTTVPSGETLQIAPGTTIVFLEFDQDSNGIGDFDLTVNGTLEVLGTEAEPVLFTTYDTNGADNPSSWGEIKLIGSGHDIAWATFEYGDNALRVQGSATLSDLEFRDNKTGIVVNGSGSVTGTNLLVHRSSSHGVTSSGTFDVDGFTTRDNGGHGMMFTGGSGNTIDNCSVHDNTLSGFHIDSANVTIDTCSILLNGYTGVTWTGGATGTQTHTNVRNNAYEGVRVHRGTSSSPSPTIHFNNIFENGASGSMAHEAINLSRASTNSWSSGNTNSATWTAPNGGKLLMMEAGYSENSSGSTITGAVRASNGTALKTWTSSSGSTWTDITSYDVGAIYAQVYDTYQYGSGTTTISNVLHDGGAAGKQLTTYLGGGSVDARFNYLGAWPDVLSTVTYAQASHLNLEGFVGVPFEEDWSVGPYRGGATIEGDVVWDDDIYVTGNVLVASGATLTVAAGVTVTFVPTDQDGDDQGDWRINRQAGSLLVEGTVAQPVSFEVLGDIPAEGGFYALDGSTSGITDIAHATITGGWRCLQSAAGTTTLTGVTITDCRQFAGYFSGSASVSATGSTFTANASGLYTYTSGVVTSDQCSFTNNTAWGLTLSNSLNASNTVTNATVTDNGDGGVWLSNAKVALSQANIKFNGYGLRVTDACTGSVTASNIQSNNNEGVYMERGANGAHPTLSVTGNNIYANTVLSQVGYEAINLSRASSNSYSSGNTDSAWWTSPDGGRIMTFEASYSENSSGSTITGAVIGNGEVALKSWSSSAGATWTTPGQDFTQLKARVYDTYQYGSGTTTIHRVLYEKDAVGGGEATVWSTQSGKYNLTGNYWGLTVPTATQVVELSANTADYTQFKTTPISGTGPQ